MNFIRQAQADAEKKYERQLIGAAEVAIEEYRHMPKEAAHGFVTGDIRVGQLENARDEWSDEVKELFLDNIFKFLQSDGEHPDEDQDWIEFANTCAEKLTDLHAEAPYAEVYRSALDEEWGWIYDHI